MLKYQCGDENAGIRREYGNDVMSKTCDTNENTLLLVMPMQSDLYHGTLRFPKSSSRISKRFTSIEILHKYKLF